MDLSLVTCPAQALYLFLKTAIRSSYHWAVGGISPTETCCWVVILTQVSFFLSTCSTRQVQSSINERSTRNKQWIPRKLNSMQMPSGHRHSYISDGAKWLFLTEASTFAALLLVVRTALCWQSFTWAHNFSSALKKMQLHACAISLPCSQNYLRSAQVSYDNVETHIMTSPWFPHSSDSSISRLGPVALPTLQKGRSIRLLPFTNQPLGEKEIYQKMSQCTFVWDLYFELWSS